MITAEGKVCIERAADKFASEILEGWPHWMVDELCGLLDENHGDALTQFGVRVGQAVGGNPEGLAQLATEALRDRIARKF